MLTCMRQFNTAERCGQQQQKIVHVINIVCVCGGGGCFVLFFRKVKYAYEINKKDNNRSFVLKCPLFPVILASKFLPIYAEMQNWEHMTLNILM